MHILPGTACFGDESSVTAPLGDSFLNAFLNKVLVRGHDYQVPVPRQITEAQTIFSRWLAGEVDPALKTRTQALGLDVIYPWAGQQLALLYTPLSSNKGWGYFIIRMEGATDPVLLQAPHQFYDLRTGAIAVKGFASSSVKALNVNQVPRYYTKGQVKRKKGKTENADMAHHPQSLWTAFALAFAEQYPAGRVVQLHGFSQAKRTTLAAREADVIISSGERSPSQAVDSLAQCLQKTDAFGAVRRFPDEVKELGATRNQIGRYLRAVGHQGFVHIELSSDLRQTLDKDIWREQQFFQCVSGLPG